MIGDYDDPETWRERARDARAAADKPKTALPGRPWSWCMEFPDAFTERCAAPQLLAAGFHHVHIVVGNTFGSSFGISRGWTNELCTGTGLIVGVGVDFGAPDGAGGGGGGGGGGAAPDARNAWIVFSSAPDWCAADAPMKMMKATMPR